MKRKTLLQSFIVHNNRIKDFFRIMRISLFLLFVCVCQLMAVEAGAQSAEIKISQNSMTIRQLVKEIEAQTEYLVVFRDQDVDAERVVSFKTKSASVANYLEELSENANIGYRFDNNYITLVPRTTATAQNKKTVTGTIVDANGEPIIGANIVEKGTTNGTITDIDGNFTLEVSEKSILLVSFIGYAPQEVMVGSQQKINVKMKEDTEMLDEVVVVGYGTQKKSDVTTAVASVSSENLKNRAAVNFGEAMAGQVPGVLIQQTNGAPGGEGLTSCVSNI